MRRTRAGREQRVVVGRAGDGLVHQRATQLGLRLAGQRTEAIGVEGPHRLSMSSPMSAAGAEWVSAPTLITSTPAAASAGTRSKLTPPETSTKARPCARSTATAI